MEICKKFLEIMNFLFKKYPIKVDLDNQGQCLKKPSQNQLKNNLVNLVNKEKIITKIEILIEIKNINDYFKLFIYICELYNIINYYL